MTIERDYGEPQPLYETVLASSDWDVKPPSSERNRFIGPEERRGEDNEWADRHAYDLAKENAELTAKLQYMIDEATQLAKDRNEEILRASRSKSDLLAAREALARIGRECPGLAREIAWGALPKPPIPAQALKR